LSLAIHCILWKEEEAMTGYLWKLMVIVIFLPALVLQGCSVEGGDTIMADGMAPAEPRGVRSITGDGQVLIEWYPNQETDLEGYIIYSNLEETGKYEEIARVGRSVSSYVDEDVDNGVTYYYAVSAYDREGNESDPSPVIEDTPRPEGRNVTLEDYILKPNLSGFDFSRPERGAQMFDRADVDIYFGIDGEVSVPYIYSDTDVEMQDLGYTDFMDDVDVSPTKGFTTLFVEAIIGHTYAFLTPDGHYAKVRITDMDIQWSNGDVLDAWMTFEWAHQLQIDNPELAPAKN
jgi:hypothetical protein